MKVWSYWRCTACDNIIRGDSRSCPSCGQPIPNDVKYLMPDNPEVMAAIAENKVLIGNKSTPKSEKHTDEKGVVSDIVPKELESDKPNWQCNYCGYQNYFADTTCKGCGAGKVGVEECCGRSLSNGTGVGLLQHGLRLLQSDAIPQDGRTLG